ncbi:homeobox protein engrailed-1-like [Tyto alba]|uniref:homeobox protein engrailed-1-like n=1 Tax=Tyto alba TaxID=56313 RepID=UPI001C66756D|nr:homeobox protein engrailed-1-like [Tyto alba]
MQMCGGRGVGGGTRRGKLPSLQLPQRREQWPRAPWGQCPAEPSCLGCRTRPPPPRPPRDPAPRSPGTVTPRFPGDRHPPLPRGCGKTRGRGWEGEHQTWGKVLVSCSTPGAVTVPSRLWGHPPPPHTPGSPSVPSCPSRLLPQTPPGAPARGSTGRYRPVRRWVRPSGATGDRHTGKGGEKRSPRCFDHRGPAASTTGDGDEAKWLEQKGAPKPAWSEPRADHPPCNTLALEITGWRSPVGHRGLGFLTWGSRWAGRRLLLARVCSCKGVRGRRGRAGLVTSLHGKGSACGPRQGTSASLPQGCLRPLASPGWGWEQGRWQEVTLQIPLQPPALEGQCHATFP